ncbi:Rod shape-determining protein MreD [Rhizobium leguminosarum]|nr:Rod shape-determining protein MreD [Rhizobium leguminosarum]
MSKKNISLVYFTNFIAYISLQVIIGQASIHFYRSTCFVYIGFFLCLPWYKTNLILQLLLGFFVGLIIDAFYDSLGIHAFAVVLLIYLRNLLLHLLPPIAVNDYEYAARPSLYSMGFKKFSIYVLFLTAMYHTTVFFLDAWGFMSFFTMLPQVLISIILSYFIICSFQILSAIVSNTSSIR